METEIVIALAAVSFTAGFVDSIAGGGGLLMIPALLLAGVPPHLSLGTNKFVASFGTGVAVVNFLRKKLVAAKILAAGIFFSIIGSQIGARLILHFSEEVVGKVIVFMLPIGIIATLYPKGAVVTKGALRRVDFFVTVPIICLAIGFYDGFFGPGTGSLLAIALYVSLKLNLVEATANAKVFNLFSNVAGLATFIVNGKVMYAIVLPLAAANMLGNYLGSHLAIKKGAGFIKAFLAFVIVILIATLVWKYFVHPSSA